MNGDRFLIISGLSGSGKTTVSHFLEDLGYYCMDNIPVKLIPQFIDLWQREEVKLDKVALVMDIRETGFITEFPKILAKIRMKTAPKLFFLEASDEVLVKRFSESRRPHPLARKKTIIENVRLERQRLAEIKKMADEVIDTTSTSVAELKTRLTRRFSRVKDAKMQVVVISFGYKYGIPLDSDLVFDTRFLPNPYYVESLRNKTGRHRLIKEFVLGSKETQKFLGELTRFLDYVMPNFVKEGKSNLTLSIGCTGGKHRSVVLAKKVTDHLKEKKYNVQAYHRDIYK